MRFKPSIWFPISVILAGVNLGAIAFAVGEPWHAMSHGALAVAFGLWAQRLKQRRDQGLAEEREAIEAPDGERMGALEDELTRLRQELGEAQERLDFTERMLAQRGQQGQPRVEPRP
jgi:hypothetical protein